MERIGNRMERQERKNSGDGKPAKAKFDWKLLPDVLALIKPRRWILLARIGLMVINRLSGSGPARLHKIFPRRRNSEAPSPPAAGDRAGGGDSHRDSRASLPTRLRNCYRNPPGE